MTSPVHVFVPLDGSLLVEDSLLVDDSLLVEDPYQFSLKGRISVSNVQVLLG